MNEEPNVPEDDPETTEHWDTDRWDPVGQEPEDPQRTREWDQDKKPAKK